MIVVSFEESLDLLSAVVKKSRNKALKVAFVNYLNNFNTSMRTYIAFLELMRGIMPQPQLTEQKWDVNFERRKH